MRVLTADCGRGVEGGRDLLVKLYAELPLHDEGFVAIVDLLLDPFNERLSDDGRHYIDDPLLRDLPELLTVRQVPEHLRVVAECVQHPLEAQVLVGGHANMDHVSHPYV